MENLAQFSINNLKDLISEKENFFAVDDYVEVKFIYRVVKVVERSHSSLLHSPSGSHANRKQISPQHHRHVDK